MQNRMTAAQPSAWAGVFLRGIEQKSLSLLLKVYV